METDHARPVSRRGAHRRRLPTATALLTLLLLLPAAVSAAGAEEDEIWTLPGTHHLYLVGVDGADRNLTRTIPIPNGPTGNVAIPAAPIGESDIAEFTGEPVQKTATIRGNLIARFFISAQSADLTCTISGQFGQTTIRAVLWSGDEQLVELTAGPLLVRQGGWSESTLLESEPVEVDLSFTRGEQLRLTLHATHRCSNQATLWYGGREVDSGLVFAGPLLQPDLDVRIDASAHASIAFVPISPWLDDDYGPITMHLYGPFDAPDERQVGLIDAELYLEEIVQPSGTRTLPGDVIATVWSGRESLSPGPHMLVGTLDTPDGQEIEVTVLFTVEDTAEQGVDAGWMLLAIPLLLIGWIAFRWWREGMYPWPFAVMIVLMCAALIPLVLGMPSIGPDADTRQGGAAPDFSLLAHGGGLVSLDSLMEGHEAVVLAVFDPASPEAEQQRIDLEGALSRPGLGERIGVAQMATGGSIVAEDLDPIHARVNGSWPILRDEGSGDIARALPLRGAEGIVVIDRGGWVTWWNGGSASADQIETAVDEIRTGAGRSPADLLGVLWPGVLVLALLALPRERHHIPETPLFPGSGLAGTFGAAALGFLIWCLPVLVLSLSPVRGAVWTWVEVGLAGVMAWHAVATVIWGRPPELGWIVGQVHGRLPVGFREWRPVERFSGDAMLGLWVAWLGWISHPYLVPQGLGATALSGILGALVALFFLLGSTLVAGLIALVARIVGGMGGPLSMAFGSLAQPEVVRFWGLLAVLLALWVGTDALLEALLGGGAV